jgi:hypothetical protein
MVLDSLPITRQVVGGATASLNLMTESLLALLG